MISLSAAEAGELSGQLGKLRSAHAASQTMTVSANASTSVTFTDPEKAAVLDALTRLLAAEPSVAEGLHSLRSALARDLGVE
jgi:hypothetical protein